MELQVQLGASTQSKGDSVSVPVACRSSSEQMKQMGFSESSAQAALAACDGDLAQAVEVVLAEQQPSERAKSTQGTVDCDSSEESEESDDDSSSTTSSKEDLLHDSSSTTSSEEDLLQSEEQAQDGVTCEEVAKQDWVSIDATNGEELVKEGNAQDTDKSQDMPKQASLVSELVDMGFEENAAVSALRCSNGEMKQAVRMLVQEERVAWLAASQ